MSKERETCLNLMKKFFLSLGLCSLGGSAIIIFIGGQLASVPTALLGLISLATGACAVFAAGILKAKESTELLRLSENETEFLPTPDCRSVRHRKPKDRFSL